MIMLITNEGLRQSLPCKLNNGRLVIVCFLPLQTYRYRVRQMRELEREESFLYVPFLCSSSSFHKERGDGEGIRERPVSRAPDDGGTSRGTHGGLIRKTRRGTIRGEGERGRVRDQLQLPDGSEVMMDNGLFK